MSTYDESMDRNLEIEEQLTKRYFWFLVDRYGFHYQKFQYRSQEMKIVFEIGHVTPRIFINKVGEPDFVRIQLDWILQFFHGFSPTDIYGDFTRGSLEDNMIFFATMLRENAPKLIHELNNWWIPVQLFMYHRLETYHTKHVSLEEFIAGNREFYDYLKSNGAL